MISLKEQQKIMKGVNYLGKYAIGKLHFGDKLNLFLFCEMDKKGYDLITINFGEAIFKIRELKK